MYTRATYAHAGAPWRDIQLPLVALHHHLHGLGPPADHLVGRELGGLASVVRAVELVAAREVGGGAALIVAEAPARWTPQHDRRLSEGGLSAALPMGPIGSLARPGALLRSQVR